MNNHCSDLHKVFNSFKRYTFPFDSDSIVQNGIYILFEKGEFAHGTERIVRVGTHTGDNQLISRINQHFVMKNKDRSIFRKNIGRAILNSMNDSYLDVWEIDFTTKENKERYGHLINNDYQMEIETKISDYIQKNFSFVVIEVSDKGKRLMIESRIISEVSNCDICKSSSNWLGRYSTKSKIVSSGLWLVNELYKDNFKELEYEEFKKELKDGKCN